MRRLVFILSFAVTMPAVAECPIGSYPWADAWGNQICKRFGSGSTSAVSGSLDKCPTGTHPWVDNWGNKICQSFNAPGQSAQHLYDTSRGCPIGTFAWTDTWGNAICKRF